TMDVAQPNFTMSTYSADTSHMLSISAIDIPLSSTCVRPVFRGLRLRVVMPNSGRPFLCMSVAEHVLPSARAYNVDSPSVADATRAWYGEIRVGRARAIRGRSKRHATCRAAAWRPGGCRERGDT